MTLILKSRNDVMRAWAISFALCIAFFIVLSQLFDIRSLPSIVSVTLLFAIIMSDELSYFEMDKILNGGKEPIFGGLFSASLIFEIFRQSEGFWPSIFWMDLIFLFIASVSICFVKAENGISWEFGLFIVSISGIIDSILRAIDQYQSLSSLGFFRVIVWGALCFGMIYAHPIVREKRDVGILVGSIIGFISYVGMVTGRTRFVGDSFAIPNEILSIIFAYSVIVFPWLIVSILSKRLVYSNNSDISF